MIDTETYNELSLIDYYLIIRRNFYKILGLPITLAALTLLVSLILPKTYSSKVVVSLGLTNQSGLLNNLPSLAGLAQGFVDLQTTRLLVEELQVRDPRMVYKAKFDEKKGLLNLSAKGKTPAEARERAQRILETSRKYLQERMTESASSNLRASLAQTNIDLQSSRESLQRIQSELKSLFVEGRSDPVIAAALESREVSPDSARNSNPAYTSLSLDESRLRSTVAQLKARISTLTPLLTKPDLLSQLIGQALQVQVLVPPAEPLRPSFPRIGLFTTIAGILGFLGSVFWVLLAEAFVPRQIQVAPVKASEIAGK